jgi:hypothetical protein
VNKEVTGKNLAFVGVLLGMLRLVAVWWLLSFAAL